jgi:hypothetical protein
MAPSAVLPEVLAIMHARRKRTITTNSGLALKMAGVIVVILLLAGCTSLSAGVPNTQSAAAVAGVSTAEAQQGWMTAANVTVTPAPASPTQGPADNSTAAADNQAQTSAAVQFTGTVGIVPSGNNWEGVWRIDGHTAYVSPSTVVDEQRGGLGKGAQVEVEGWSRPDGSVDAGWIHVLSGVAASTPAAAIGGPNVTPTATATASATSDPATSVLANPQSAAPESENDSQGGNRSGRQLEFRGVVESLPASGLVGDWRVSGRIIHASAGTRIRQQHWALSRGALVQILGWLQPDGSINAASIDTKNPRSDGGPDHPGNGNDNGKGNDNGNGNGKGNDNGKDGGG